MIERDDHIPALDELICELDHAREIASDAVIQAAQDPAGRSVAVHNSAAV
jgi:hypothetical protein